MSISHEKSPTLKDKTKTYATLDISRFLWFLPPHVGIVTTFNGLWVSEPCLVTWRDLHVLLSGIDTPRKGFPAPSPFSSTRLHNLDVFLLCSLHWKGFLGRICCRAEKEFPLVRTAKYFTTLVAVKAYSKSKKRTSLIASQQLVVSWEGGTHGRWILLKLGSTKLAQNRSRELSLPPLTSEWRERTALTTHFHSVKLVLCNVISFLVFFFFLEKDWLFQCVYRGTIWKVFFVHECYINIDIRSHAIWHLGHVFPRWVSTRLRWPRS